jgi:hypothetical protein
MRRSRLFVSMLAFVFVAAASVLLFAQQKPDPHANEVPPPGQPPRVVTPGQQPGAAPSDAIVLFDGKDLSPGSASATAHRRRGRSPTAP